MTYVSGFLLAAPTANREAYRKQAEEAWPMFKGYGALNMVEGWGDQVPDGKINSINSAVMRKEDETSLFSWVVWPDKKTSDEAERQMMADMEGKEFPEMPFDGKRMIIGGFQTIVGDPTAKIGYIDGTVMPVQADKREAYTAASEKMAALFKEYGAISVVDAWGDNLPEGKVNDFHMAVLRKPDETVVFSWINWKDKATRDAAWEKVMADPRMEEFGPHTAGVDMSRMIFGSFVPLVDV
ncbi:hypothetical protein BBF93_03945 [Hyphomonas sp. CACIAM 19H1]|uniref:DUF1428 domain-containing protein n=1 Tax=Hyphomonas sp. CACIAM 19H1 TaxID=1873716 RepID=UPI000DED4643|nr:DUF1428 domain-containing protein [Hyphomonas sp. CACIAM 19H1]AXE63463.1 hypothetical protein BBF93_03945 [Hyphomonas sp. CACIAM 19H1]